MHPLTLHCVTKFLVEYNIRLLNHPPYSPEVAPCHFHLSPKVNSALKGTIFQIVEAANKKLTIVTNELTVLTHNTYNIIAKYSTIVQPLNNTPRR